MPIPRDDLRGFYALAVDDNETNLQLVRAQTRAWGMVCDIATECACGLDDDRPRPRQVRPYDVAILDMQMPDMDGLELAQSHQGDPAHAQMRLVLMTSMAQRGHAAQSALAGFDAYLHKPVRQAQLYECLRTVMGLPGLRPRRPARRSRNGDRPLPQGGAGAAADARAARGRQSDEPDGGDSHARETRVSGGRGRPRPRGGRRLPARAITRSS